MRAIRILENGGPEVLTLGEVPDPVPGAGQIVVDVAAAGVNFVDTYQRGGLYPVAVPFTAGLEG
ncbi:MAG: quinone oxidoreductase, partial [Acidimicrobiia bacterium]|nr:quinone oxidoreductase [Acidimicrobiia bacterium]